MDHHEARSIAETEARSVGDQVTREVGWRIDDLSHRIDKLQSELDEERRARKDGDYSLFERFRLALMR